MARLHRTYNESEIPEVLVTITREFFESSPWHGSPQQRYAKFQAWWSAACEASGYDDGTIVIVRSPEDFARIHPSINPVPLAGLSVLDLFHAFRHLMIRMGHEPRMEDPCNDSYAWGTCMYFICRRNTFIKSVHKGLIPGVTPMDLVEMDDAGCVLDTAQRTAFESLTESFVESLGDDDHELMDLMAEFSGDGN